MKKENKRKWDHASRTLIPDPQAFILGLTVVDKDAPRRRPSRRNQDEVTVVCGLDPRIKRGNQKPLTQSLGSVFEEVGL